MISHAFNFIFQIMSNVANFRFHGILIPNSVLKYEYEVLFCVNLLFNNMSFLGGDQVLGRAGNSGIRSKCGRLKASGMCATNLFSAVHFLNTDRPFGPMHVHIIPLPAAESL